MYVIVARLDGTNKPMKHTTIEDYLQMDGWHPPPSSTNGKKRVCFMIFLLKIGIKKKKFTSKCMMFLNLGSMG